MRSFTTLALATLLAACGGATSPNAQRDPFAQVYVRIDTGMRFGPTPTCVTIPTCFDTSVSYLAISTFVPPQPFTRNGMDDLLSNQWFLFTGKGQCTEIFSGAGFTDVQQLAFTVIPVHLMTKNGAPYKLSGGGDNGVRIDTLILFSGGVPYDTLLYTPVVTGVQSDPFDPFALPLPAPWGRDPAHLTTWNIHVFDTTRV